MELGRVAGLWRHPVKSLGGQQVQALAFDGRGAVGDRAWAVYTADGGIGSGKTSRRFRRLEGLLDCVATLGDPLARTPGDDPRGTAAPVVTLPDGRRLVAGSPELDDAMSAHVGQPVTVRPEGAVPHFDDSPVHVGTTASLRAAGALQDGGPVEAVRFRMNVLLDVDVDGYPEDAWSGIDVALGDVVLRIGELMPRCVMVTLPQRELPRASGLLKALGAGHGATLGVMAQVVRPGTVRVGDPVRSDPAAG